MLGRIVPMTSKTHVLRMAPKIRPPVRIPTRSIVARIPFYQQKRLCTTAQEQLLERWMRLFRTFDQDRNGTIDRAEFTTLLTSLEFEGKQSKIDEIFAKLDSDGSGQIDKQEYLKLMQTLTETERDD